MAELLMDIPDLYARFGLMNSLHRVQCTMLGDLRIMAAFIVATPAERITASRHSAEFYDTAVEDSITNLPQHLFNLICNNKGMAPIMKVHGYEYEDTEVTSVIGGDVSSADSSDAEKTAAKGQEGHHNTQELQGTISDGANVQQGTY